MPFLEYEIENESDEEKEEEIRNEFYSSFIYGPPNLLSILNARGMD